MKKPSERGEKKGLSKEEISAMKDYLKEKNAKDNGEKEVLAKIASLPEPDRSMARRLHAIIKANAPSLIPRTWYGMPAYADKEGDVICFFQPASKFKARYGTLGFNGGARLDEGKMWPTSFALTGLTHAEESKIAALVKRAVG